MTEDDVMQCFYVACALNGIDPNKFTFRYSDEVLKCDVSVALVEQKIVFALPGDDIGGLSSNGWRVFQTSKQQLEMFAVVFTQISEASAVFRSSISEGEMVKKGSKEEQALLVAMIKRRIPEPNRNLSIKNPETGLELTVPDFAWEDIKLAFFVDGLWWHVSKDDSAIADQLINASKKDAKSIKKNIVDNSSSKVEKDLNARSIMTMDGWAVIACTDKDLSTPEGVERQVTRIYNMIKKLELRRGVGKLNTVDDNDILDLL